MKALVVGLGSMGRRRVRNMQALGGIAIAGFDPRADRRREAADKYGIAVFEGFEAALAAFQPAVLVISTGPSHHMTYAFAALERGLSCFIEASVVDSERILELATRVEGTRVLMAPSCTMRHFPGPRKVREWLASGVIGAALTATYHVGQYLSDWHPWERIQDFYVSDRATGGAREIVPFELTWLNDTFGVPEALACVKAKLSDLDADIDDVYHAILRYPGGMLMNLVIDVIARPHATRELRILGSTGELVYSGDEQCVRYASTGATEWVRHDLAAGTVESGYIYPEEPYIAEMRDFFAAVVQGRKELYPNTLRDDYRVLQTLLQLEALSERVP